MRAAASLVEVLPAPRKRTTTHTHTHTQTCAGALKGGQERQQAAGGRVVLCRTRVAADHIAARARGDDVEAAALAKHQVAALASINRVVSIVCARYFKGEQSDAKSGQLLSRKP